MEPSSYSASDTQASETTSIGPLMVDIEGLSLTDDDRNLLSNTWVGGLILFSRNYASPFQLAELVSAVRQCNPNLLVAVDHEGGRVQRFREGFTRIPPMRVLGERYTQNAADAIELAKQCGWLFASELRAFDIDFSFAPVLDLDYGVSSVIGDRAFSNNVDVVSVLAKALVEGMREAGMSSTGKHFPGHGAVEADSHVAIPVDSRDFESIASQDIVPFKRMIAEGLNAVMPAHVIYPKVDAHPAGFSRFWLGDVLRQQLGFNGVIFSDDLTMEGASVAGGYAKRAGAALEAGCDMILVCNNREGALEALQYLECVRERESLNESSQRLRLMQGRGGVSLENLKQSERWLAVVGRLKQLGNY